MQPSMFRLFVILTVCSFTSAIGQQLTFTSPETVSAAATSEDQVQATAPGASSYSEQDVEEDVSIFMQHATIVDSKHPIKRWIPWLNSPVFRALLAALLLIPALIAYAGDGAFQGTLRGHVHIPTPTVADAGRALAASNSIDKDKILDALLQDTPCCEGPIGLQTSVELMPAAKQPPSAVTKTSAKASISDDILDQLLEGAEEEAAMIASTLRLQTGVKTVAPGSRSSSRVPALSGQALDELVAGANEEAEMTDTKWQEKTPVASAKASLSNHGAAAALDSLVEDANEEAALTASFGVQTEVKT